jgi:hypothetical protein
LAKKVVKDEYYNYHKKEWRSASNPNSEENLQKVALNVLKRSLIHGIVCNEKKLLFSLHTCGYDLLVIVKDKIFSYFSKQNDVTLISFLINDSFKLDYLKNKNIIFKGTYPNKETKSIEIEVDKGVKMDFKIRCSMSAGGDGYTLVESILKQQNWVKEKYSVTIFRKEDTRAMVSLQIAYLLKRYKFNNALMNSITLYEGESNEIATYYSHWGKYK